MTIIESPTLTNGGAIERPHPWHALGTQVQYKSIDEALAMAGSDDEIEYRNLFYNPDFGDAPVIPETEMVEVDDHIGIVSSKYGLMGVAGPNYEITTPREMLEIAYDVVGLDPEGRHVDTIGRMGVGMTEGKRHAKFFAYIKVPDLVIDPNGIADVIERGLAVGTSYDKSLPNFFGYSQIRVWCANQLTMNFRRGLDQYVSVKHTKNAEQRLRIAARAEGYLGEIEKATASHAEKMLRVPGDKAFDALVKDLWPITEDDNDNKKMRTARIRGDVRMMYDGPGNLSVDKAGRNGYAAYNAVTDYIDHAREIRVKSKGISPTYQRAYGAVMSGEATKMKARASDLVLSLN